MTSYQLRSHMPHLLFLLVSTKYEVFVRYAKLLRSCTGPSKVQRTLALRDCNAYRAPQRDYVTATDVMQCSRVAAYQCIADRVPILTVW